MSLEGVCHCQLCLILLVTFTMSLEGVCHEVEVNRILKLIVTFGMSWEGVSLSWSLVFEIFSHFWHELGGSLSCALYIFSLQANP
jgi:hypothetical protein